MASPRAFGAIDATAANIDRITDFRGNGATAGDMITFGNGANAFGAGLTFNGTTSTTVTAVTISMAGDAIDFTTLRGGHRPRHRARLRRPRLRRPTMSR